MSSRLWIIDLAQVGADDRPRVGGKAWRLGRLLQAGFPVSPGFCFTTAACAAWGPAVREELLAAYRRLGGAVAVRSSALEEDGEGASYAGVYGSELPVEGEAALVAAVERCLASWESPEARAYRARAGGAGESGLALLVQRLVPAVAAGIAYTCDPLQPRRRQVHIDAVWGLAEPLAAGRVRADSYVLARSGRLLRQSIAEKRSQLTAAGQAAVAPGRVHSPCLGPAAARRVARLALAAEAHFGAPQDVEFALTAEGPWLLQSRPIVPPAGASPLESYLEGERQRLKAKFARLRRQGILLGREAILSNGNVGELLPTPTPMSFGLFQALFAGPGGAVATGRHRLGYRFDPGPTAHLYELVAGQVYFNLEVDAATFDYGASPAADFYLDRVAADPGLANYPEVHLYRQHYTLAEARECFGEVGAASALCRSEAFHQGMLEQAAAFLAGFPDLSSLSLRERDRGRGLGAEGGMAPTGALTAPSPHPLSPSSRGRGTADAIARTIAGRIRDLRTGLCVEFVMAARLGFYFAARVRQRLVGWLGDAGESLCAPLLSGLPGSRVTEEGLDLERVLAGALGRREFLAAYGHTAPNELELSEPRLSETPGRLDAMLRDLAAAGRSPAADFTRQQGQRSAAEAALAGRLAGAGVPAGDIAACLEELHFAQSLLPLRETIKHRYTQGYAAIRRDLLGLAQALGWENDLVFHLYPRELARAAQDPAPWRARAEARQAERRLALEAARLRLLPNVIFASRLAAIGQPPRAATGRTWRGQGLSPGRAWGVARVIDGDDVQGGDFAGDEILVLRSANLGLAPLFRLVAGVVVEVGGLLAHSACQAREAGIPAVLLPGAAGQIPDGCRLAIDGAAGTVHVLSPENPKEHHDCPTNDLAAV